MKAEGFSSFVPSFLSPVCFLCGDSVSSLAFLRSRLFWSSVWRLPAFLSSSHSWPIRIRTSFPSSRNIFSYVLFFLISLLCLCGDPVLHSSRKRRLDLLSNSFEPSPFPYSYRKRMGSLAAIVVVVTAGKESMLFPPHQWERVIPLNRRFWLQTFLNQQCYWSRPFLCIPVAVSPFPLFLSLLDRVLSLI